MHSVAALDDYVFVNIRNPVSLYDFRAVFRDLKWVLMPIKQGPSKLKEIM